MELFDEARALLAEMKEHRQKIHRIAETGFELKDTMAHISAALKEMGTEPIACGGGIFADIGTGERTVILRADCDALPIREESGLPFAAENGNAHACGHDLHCAMLLGAARLLMAREGELKHKIRLVFQPAEELLTGAKSMIENGVLDGNACAAYGLHVIPSLPLPCGTVMLPPTGAVAPYADFFRITVKGKGAHGAAPHTGRDALLCGANILLALQTPIAREVAPSSVACLTVGSITGGKAANAISNTAVLEGTLRAFDRDERDMLLCRTREIAEHIAIAFGCRAETERTSYCPALVNDAGLLNIAKEALDRTIPQGYVLDASETGASKSIGGSEDFAFFSERVPSLFFSISAGSSPHALHHPAVVFDEDCLPYGAAALAALGIKNNY